jgi:hypothetical protein
MKKKEENIRRLIEWVCKITDNGAKAAYVSERMVNVFEHNSNEKSLYWECLDMGVERDDNLLYPILCYPDMDEESRLQNSKLHGYLSKNISYYALNVSTIEEATEKYGITLNEFKKTHHVFISEYFGGVYVGTDEGEEEFKVVEKKNESDLNNESAIDNSPTYQEQIAMNKWAWGGNEDPC